jgi:hypothetical protein
VHEDFLFIVAEIAAAFAGFASLVAAISRRADRTLVEQRLDFGTLQNVLMLSLLTVAFALLPNLLERQDLDTALAWRASAAAFAVVVGIYATYVLKELPGVYRDLGKRVPPTFRVNAGLLLAGLILDVFCVFGALPLSIYLLGLAALLYNAGFGFVRLFVSMKPGSPLPER